jgi:hypothetical protein
MSLVVPTATSLHIFLSMEGIILAEWAQ